MLYPYCPKQFREADYSFQMVTREIRGDDADLIMLQVSKLIFKRALSPHCDQLNGGRETSLSPFAPESLSHELGSAIPSRVIPIILHTQAESSVY